MKNIVVLTTGGTISTKRGPQWSGAVPLLKGDDFLAMLPRGEYNVTFQDFTNLPSSHITPTMALDLAQRIGSILLGDADGVAAPAADGAPVRRGRLRGGPSSLQGLPGCPEQRARQRAPLAADGACRSLAEGG